ALMDAHVHVDASRARRLGPALEAEVGQDLPSDPGHVLDLTPLDARHRVEVDPELVGMVEVFGADRVRMELQASQVRHPGERGRIAWYDLFRRAAGRKTERDDFDPIRPRGGRSLLVEELAVNPVGIADEHVRPAPRSAQRALGDGEVVAYDVELGDPGLREVDLARVGDRDLAPADVDHDLLALARHPTSIRRLLTPVEPRDP